MALYAWASDHIPRKPKYVRIVFPLVILVLSDWSISFSCVSIYPAALLMMLYHLRGIRNAAWVELLTASLLGGLLCWKVTDAWPLLPGSMLLCATLLLFPVTIICRNGKDRFLAFALSGLFFELFFCLREYLLFSYCMVRLGSRDALSLDTAALCLYGFLSRVFQYKTRKRDPAVSILN